jgi:WD40 repeat protein
MIFSVDDKILITGSNDGKVRLWDTKSLSLLKTFVITEWSIYALAISPDNQTLAVDAADGTIQLWDMQSGGKLKTFGEKGQRMKTIRFSPDGKLLASINLESMLTIWEIKSGKRLFTTQSFGFWEYLTFCQQATEVVTTNYKTVNFFNVQNGKKTRTIELPEQYVPFFKHLGGGNFGGKVVISSNCQTIAVSNLINKSLILWDSKTNKVNVLQGNALIIPSPTWDDDFVIAFSTDGRFIASGTTKGKVKLWLIS